VDVGQILSCVGWISEVTMSRRILWNDFVGGNDLVVHRHHHGSEGGLACPGSAGAAAAGEAAAGEGADWPALGQRRRALQQRAHANHRAAARAGGGDFTKQAHRRFVILIHRRTRLIGSGALVC